MKMKLMTVSFKVSDAEAQIIEKIARRACDMARKHGRKWSPLDVQMDITATHANGCPLDLQKFLDADEFNFAHDMLGIAENLDRRTGNLGNCFLPRCARH